MVKNSTDLKEKKLPLTSNHSTHKKTRTYGIFKLLFMVLEIKVLVLDRHTNVMWRGLNRN